MPIEPVKIPQNVYVEDRIIGPITLKQLAIVGIGTGISYAMFASASRGGSISIPLGVMLWTPAMISAMFAFLKVNDLTLFNLILLAIEHSNKPTQRYWSSHQGISINFVSKAFKQAVIDANTKISENANKLAELTRQMEHREEELAKLANHMPVEEAPPPQQAANSRRLDGIGVTPDHKGTAKPAPAAAPAETVPQERVQVQGLDPSKSVDGFTAGKIAPAASPAAAEPEAAPAAPEEEMTKKKSLDAFKHIFPQD